MRHIGTPMHEVTIKAPSGESRIIIGEGLLNETPRIIELGLGYLPRKHLLMVDSALRGSKQVKNLEGLPGLVIMETSGEASKSIEAVLKAYDTLIEGGFHRDDAIVALGGGATSDLAGFVAGTYMRGIPLINIPTTLLGMIDGAIGGKSGINYRNIKNIIGVFHQPRLVIIDVALLDTLNPRDYTSGFAEAIKYGIILNSNILNFLKNNKDKLTSRDHDTLIKLIKQCVETKGKVVEIDEKETSGYRMSLNFGHTIGHALELRTNLTHGESVALGMIIEGKLAVKLGLMKHDDYETMKKLIENYGLPTKIPHKINTEDLHKYITMDKKTRENNHIIIPLPTSLGNFKLEKIKINDLIEAINETLQETNP